MAEIYYPGIAAGDAASVQPDGTVVQAIVQPNAFVQVFETTDTARATPLTLKSMSGLTFTQVQIGSLPVLPDLYVVSENFKHIWKSGDLEFRRDSNDAKDKAVADAVTATQESAAAALESAKSAALAEQAATGNPRSTQLTYDAKGNVETVTEGGVTTGYTYNPDGSVATDTRLGVIRAYTYANGNLTGIEVA